MNTLVVSRWMTRLALPVALVCFALLWWNFGLLSVPHGMDTMPESHPAGTVCVIDKRPPPLVSGAVIFLDLQDGSTVLTRVAATGEGTVTIRHDNRQSRFCYLEDEGPYPEAAVRGLVLTKFLPDDHGVPNDGR